MSSSSSINMVSSSGKNYMPGLVSGMDTESLVQSMLSGTQSKIDKQTGLKQQLEWKQDIYRSLITKINTFGDKYFSFYGNSNTNLTSSSLYSTMTGVSSSPNVKITSVSGNAVSNMKIDSITRLATSCTVKSGGTVTGEAVGGVSDLDSFTAGEEYSFSMTVDGVNKTISFTADADKDVTLDRINQALYRNFGTTVGLSRAASDGTMSLVKLDGNGKPTLAQIEKSRRVIIQSTGDMDTVKKLGFGTGFSNKLDYGTSLKNMNFATPLQGDNFEFEINGVTVKGLTRDSTLSDVLSAINGSGAGVKVSYSSTTDSFVMESVNTGEISNITMSQTKGNLLTMMFGANAGAVQSSLFTKDIMNGDADKLDDVRDDLNAGKDLDFVFRVDGQDVTVTLKGKTGSSKYENNQSVLNELNSQLDRKLGTGAVRFYIKKADAGSSDPDKLAITSPKHKVEFTTDNLADGFGGVLGFADGADNLQTDGTPLADTGLHGKIKIGGSVFDLEGTNAGYASTVGGLVQFMKDKLGAANVKYDEGRITISGKASMEITSSDYGTNKNPLQVLFASNEIKISPQMSGSLPELENPPGTNVLNGKINVSYDNGSGTDATLEIDLSTLASYDDLANRIKTATGVDVKYDSSTNQLIMPEDISKRFSISPSGTAGSPGVPDADAQTFLKSAFGEESVTFYAGKNPGRSATTAGQNAILSVNGTEIERNTNIFELDGITIELVGQTAAGDPAINLTTTRDTDKIVDSLKSFADDYNTLIEELNDLLGEETEYKKYAPLTSEQKKEMSDREVELWEEKAKKGLLHNDSNVSSLLSEMRMILYGSVDEAGLALYDIGIEASSNWRDNGKLVVDEEALRSVVATNADSIRKLFTDKEQGIAVKLQNAIKDTANVSSGSPGSMVRYAGTKDVLVTNNTLYQEMKRIKENLSNLNNKYKQEKARYWQQFTSMEKALSSMNSQSSWLTQQFS